MMYNDAFKSQKAALSIEHLLPLKHSPSPQSAWEMVLQSAGTPASHPLTAQHNPARALLSSKAKKGEQELSAQ